FATDAPVSRLTLKSPPAARTERMRSARAGAKALGVPALANPLIATVSPSAIRSTAEAASVTSPRKWGWRMREGSYAVPRCWTEGPRPGAYRRAVRAPDPRSRPRPRPEGAPAGQGAGHDPTGIQPDRLEPDLPRRSAVRGPGRDSPVPPLHQDQHLPAVGA